jgi:two-component system chemotaxis response regulator CheY
VVFLDMVMEGMYGLEVLSKVRELNPDARVVVATADIQKSTRDQVRAAGAAALVNKPLNREEVLSVITKVQEGGRVWN